MSALFSLAVFSIIIILIICFLFGVNDKKNPNHTASMKIIRMLQKSELDNDKNNETLSEMIEYHRKNPTDKYKI